jgi:hypothetical protein
MAAEETESQMVAYSLDLTPDSPSLMKRGDKVVIDGIVGRVVDVRPVPDQGQPMPDDLHERAEKAEASNARVAAIHPSREEADAAESALCLECLAPAPCKTRRALDGQA